MGHSGITRPAITAGVLGTVLAAAMSLAGCQYGTGGTGPSTAATPPAATSSTTPAWAAGHWIMPNLVGANLQDAQDRIQALTGKAIFFTSSHDVSGRGRHQILDRDWRVCSQNVPPGATIIVSTKIDFGVVKLTEGCP